MKLIKKILIGISAGIVVVLVAGSITIYSIWGNEISSISSIKKLADKNDDISAGAVYEMTMKGDYYFDNFIKQGGAKNDTELINYIVNNITKGIIPVSINAPTIGCSSFTFIDSETGHHMFARNYDFSTTTSMIVHTNPGEGRHKSISSVDLQFIGLSEPTTLIQKATAIASAYTPLDGLNDAGVSCGIYMSYQGPDDNVTATDQNTDLPDLTSTTMLRMILDYADDVEEAIELVKQYDFHDSANTSFHYMVADKTGKSAILEWVNGTDDTDTDGSKRELKVYYNDSDSALGDNEARDNFQYITNFIVTPDYYSSDEDKPGLDRYNYIPSTINPDGSNTSGTISLDTAKSLLKDLGRRSWNNGSGGLTVWSAIYDLDALSVYWVDNEQWDNEDAIFTYSLA